MSVRISPTLFASSLKVLEFWQKESGIPADQLPGYLALRVLQKKGSIGLWPSSGQPSSSGISSRDLQLGFDDVWSKVGPVLPEKGRPVLKPCTCRFFKKLSDDPTVNNWRNVKDTQRGFRCDYEIQDPSKSWPSGFTTELRPDCPKRTADNKCAVSDVACHDVGKGKGDAGGGTSTDVVPSPKLLRFATPKGIPQHDEKFVLVDQPITDILRAWSLGATTGSSEWDGARPPWLATAIALHGYCSDASPQKGAPISLEKLAETLGMSDADAKAFFQTRFTQGDQKLVEQTEAGLLRRFIDHLHYEKGLRFEDFEVIRTYLSLKTRPFVILAGLSGTGKSALGTELGAALGAFEAVAVRPGWDDLRPLFGHVNAFSGTFESRPAWDFFAQANSNGDKVHTLLLDEMNLSQVEHYFADVLSAFEAKEGSPLRTLRPGGGATLTWVPNLRLIGTINVDESTKGLSPKVLDRANVIEFPPPTHEYLPLKGGAATHLWTESHRMDLGKHLMATPNEAVVRNGSEGELRSDLEEPWKHIRALAVILAEAGFGIGNRPFHEILAFVAHGLDLIAEANVLQITIQGPQMRPLDAAALMDCQWLQRVLPHLNGPSHILRPCLQKLEDYCVKHDFVASAQRIQRLKKMQFVHFWSAW